MGISALNFKKYLSQKKLREAREVIMTAETAEIITILGRCAIVCFALIAVGIVFFKKDKKDNQLRPFCKINGTC
ncbi:MAG: hypothetical protein N4A38_00815 [Candidatus Gracilibacteria bacterium]|jgi:hypothetical protein|nr:hypothetical protein [Candidatus Gracilibacteria bacterium]